MISLTKAGTLATISMLCLVIPMNANVQNTESLSASAKLKPELDSIKIHIASVSFDPLKETPKIPKELITYKPNGYWIVQFKGPVKEDWKRAAEERGCALYHYIPDYGFLVFAPNERVKETIAQLPYVRALTPFQPGYKIEPELLQKTGFVNVNIVLLEEFESFKIKSTASNILCNIGAQRGISTETFSVAEYTREQSERVYEESPKAIPKYNLNSLEVLSAIARAGGEVLRKDRNIIEASIPAYVVKELAFIPSVLWIEEKYELKDCLDIARAATGAESLHGTVNTSASADPVVLGLGGKNIIIAVMDSGLRITHQDFNEPPSKIVAYLYGSGYSSEHGTLVAGCAAGDGSAYASTRPYRGLAPNAKLVIQRRWESGTTTPGLLTCFKDAYSYGASVHTNSWLLAESGKQVNRYGSYSQLADIGVRDADLDISGGQPLIITWAAGNEAGATVGEPATAKNVITIGASDDAGTATTTDDTMASFSSRGPTRDGRLKPDVVAPGVSIKAPDTLSDTSYATESGTSLSAPIGAGACAIIVEDYKARFDKKPSPALVKALLINRATPLAGYEWPGYYQGWGQVNLTEICTKWDKIYFEDQLVELNTLEEKNYYVKAATGTFRVNLVWTDAYGLINADKVLVNDLDLVVTAPDGTVYHGNDFKAPFNDSRDSVNNVEGVIITNPDLTGVYTIKVKATNIPKGPQDYALVVSNVAGGIGRVEWSDKNEFGYYKANSAVVKIYDKDLNTNPSAQEQAQVKVYSIKDPAGIALTCTEQGSDSTIFSATVNFIESGSSGGNNISVSSNDIVTARYNDTAPVNYIHVYDNATYDSASPAISNIFISSIKPSSAIIHFWTSEEAEARLWIKDNTTGVWKEDDSAGIHYHPSETYTKSHFEYILTSWRSCLKPNTEYWLQVNATDKAGNKAINNNNGNYYSFKTPTQPFKILFVDDDYGGGCGYWFSYTLNLTGYYHDYYRVPSGTANGPTAATLALYDIVVWDCGVAGQKTEWGTSLTSSDLSAIQSYLDSTSVGAMNEKPRLVVLGLGVAQEVNGTTGGATFLSNYLYCSYNKDSAGLDMTGVANDLLGDNLTADLGYDSLSTYWNYGDDISAASGGIKSFDWDGASDAGCIRYGSYSVTRQVVFLPILWTFFDSNRDGKEYGIATQLELQRRIFEDYFFAPLSSISGWVKDIHNNAIENAVVQVVDTANPSVILGAAYTNETGYYKLKWLEGGRSYKALGMAADAPAQVYDHDSYKPITAIAQQTIPNINFTLALRNDTGVVAITNPVHNDTYPLGTLNIEATVKNHGTTTQSNFDTGCEITHRYTPAPQLYFSDDFNDGDAAGWTMVSGTWSVGLDGSNYVYKQTGTDLSYSIASGTYTNYTCEARVKIVGTADKVRPGIVFRYQDTNNFYIFRIVAPTGNTADLIKNVAGLLGSLGSVSFTPVVGQWYKLTVRAQGSTIKCYIDDKLVINAVDDKFATGKIGLSSNAGENWFDDVWVNETVETIENIVYYNTQALVDSLVLNATKSLTWSYDFAKEGEYLISVRTLLGNDKNPLNDEKSIRLVINASAGFIYNFKLGWNYICLTFSNGSITKASELAVAIGNNCTKVANWSGGGFMIYDRATGASDFLLEQGRGYNVWIVNGTTKFILKGSSLASATLQLTEGWNTIGRFTATLAKASELATNIQNCTSVAYWDDETQRFVIYSKDVGFYNFNLERGKGYLVHVTSSSSWENK